MITNWSVRLQVGDVVERFTNGYLYETETVSFQKVHFK